MSKKPVFIRKLFPGRKLFSFFICILIAAFLWLINALNRTYTRTLAIPVTFTHYPIDRHINNRLPHYIMADVRASGAKLMMLLMKKSLNEITIDVSDAVHTKNHDGHASINTLSAIGNLSKLLNTDVELIKVKPDSIHFVFGRIAVKRLYIKPRVQINYETSEGLYEKIKMVPEYVMASSDSATLARLDTLYTEKIVLNDLNQNVEQQAAIELPEELENLVVLSQNKVLMKVNLDEYVQRTIKVPVEVSNLPPGMMIKTFPSQVEVTVSAPYNLYDSLNAALLSARADFSETNKKGGKLFVKIIPKNSDVKVTRCVPDRVEYVLRKK